MRIPPLRARRSLLLALGLGALAAAPSPAAAAPFTCEASVLRGAVLGTAIPEPAVANRGAACQNATAGLPVLAAGPLRAGVLNATTTLVGTATRVDQQQAFATGSVADLGVGSLASLGLALPLDAIALPPTATVPPVDISAIATALNAIPDLVVPVPTVPSTLTVDVQAAVKELLRLPTTDLVGLKSAVAFAAAGCVSGQPATFGQRSVAGLSVLGNAIDVDTASSRPIIDTQTIDPSAIDLSKVKVPVLDALLPVSGNALVKPLVAQLQAAVAAAVKALPPIAVPIELARVAVTPGGQTLAGGALTQTALGLQVSALGQPVLDLVLGEAKVGTAGVDCTPPATPAPPVVVPAPEPKTPDAVAPAVAAQAPLSCTSRRLVLTDVLRRGSRVRIKGVADKRYVGRTITIRFEADGSTAGRAEVQPNGTFTTTAAAPSARLRSTNRARYQAVLGTQKSLNLKLERRMYVDRLTAANGAVTVVGHLTKPLGRPRQVITLSRRISCKRMEVVGRVRPEPDGTFKLTVLAPEGQSSAVYRLGTKVRKTTSNPKLFPTFTLPQGVALEQ